MSSSSTVPPCLARARTCSGPWQEGGVQLPGPDHLTRLGKVKHKLRSVQQQDASEGYTGEEVTCSSCRMDWPTSASRRYSCSSCFCSPTGCRRSVPDSLSRWYKSKAACTGSVLPCTQHSPVCSLGACSYSYTWASQQYNENTLKLMAICTH